MDSLGDHRQSCLIYLIKITVIDLLLHRKFLLLVSVLLMNWKPNKEGKPQHYQQWKSMWYETWLETAWAVSTTSPEQFQRKSWMTKPSSKTLRPIRNCDINICLLSSQITIKCRSSWNDLFNENITSPLIRPFCLSKLTWKVTHLLSYFSWITTFSYIDNSILQIQWFPNSDYQERM